MLGLLSGLVTLLLTPTTSYASLATSANALNTGVCPDGWLDASEAGMGCLWAHGDDTTMTWDAANTFCNSNSNSSLVEILSTFEAEYIGSLLPWTSELGPNQAWWTSATDSLKEGEWVWLPSLKPVGDFMWGPGEPDGASGPNEPDKPSVDCMYLYIGNDYMAYDCYCEYSGTPICQIK